MGVSLWLFKQNVYTESWVSTHFSSSNRQGAAGVGVGGGEWGAGGNRKFQSIVFGKRKQTITFREKSCQERKTVIALKRRKKKGGRRYGDDVINHSKVTRLHLRGPAV